MDSKILAAEADQAVIKTLSNGKLPAAEIAQRTSMSGTRVYRALARLCKAGRVAKADGLFLLVDLLPATTETAVAPQDRAVRRLKSMAQTLESTLYSLDPAYCMRLMRQLQEEDAPADYAIEQLAHHIQRLSSEYACDAKQRIREARQEEAQAQTNVDAASKKLAEYKKLINPLEAKINKQELTINNQVATYRANEREFYKLVEQIERGKQYLESLQQQKEQITAEIERAKRQRQEEAAQEMQSQMLKMVLKLITKQDEPAVDRRLAQAEAENKRLGQQLQELEEKNRSPHQGDQAIKDALEQLQQAAQRLAKKEQELRQREESLEMAGGQAADHPDQEELTGEAEAATEKNRGTQGQLVGPGVIGGNTAQPPIDEPPTLEEMSITKRLSAESQALGEVETPGGQREEIKKTTGEIPQLDTVIDSIPDQEQEERPAEGGRLLTQREIVERSLSS